MPDASTRYSSVPATDVGRGGQALLGELSVVNQRYEAVIEVR